MNGSGIYQIRNTATGRVYVGSAVHLGRRKNGHFHALRKGRHKNPKLQASFDKHGENVFVFEVLEKCEKLDLLRREQHWIDFLGSTTRRRGFNLNPTAGSALGRKFEFRPLTDEHRRKIGESKKGKRRGVFSRDWCVKLSAAAQKPRPNQSAAMHKVWQGRPSRRTIVACHDCGKEREFVISATHRNAQSYRCRPCYLSSSRSA